MFFVLWFKRVNLKVALSWLCCKLRTIWLKMSNQYSVIILIKWIVMRNVLSRNVSFRKVAVAVSGCERQVLVLLTRNFSLLDNRIRKIRIPIHDILMSWKFLVNCPSSWNGLGREPNLKPMFIITRKLYSSQGTHPEPNSSSGYQQHEQHSNYWMKRLMKCSFITCAKFAE